MLNEKLKKSLPLSQHLLGKGQLLKGLLRS